MRRRHLGPVWPRELVVNGVKYQHFCDHISLRHQGFCVCGRLWRREGKGMYRCIEDGPELIGALREALAGHEKPDRIEPAGDADA